MALPPDLQRRVSAARTDRQRNATLVNDYLRLADPTRPRIGDSATSPADRSNEADTLYDATLQEVHEDFASDLLARLMPRNANWVTYEPEETLSDEVKRVVGDMIRGRTDAIFAAIRRSDFYDEAAGEWAGDQGHGTSGLVINGGFAGQPDHCEAIPPGQLLTDRGPNGGLGFKGRDFAMALEDALSLYPQYQWPAALRRKAQGNGKRTMVKALNAATLILDPADEMWTWQVAFDDHVVHEEKLVGRGSCPVLATRWRTHSGSSRGIGPGLKCVPDALSLDQLRYLILKNLGNLADPMRIYPDDGVLNPEGGTGAGMWLPKVPGTEQVQTLEPPENFDVTYFEQAGLQDNIRRGLYQGGPNQRGKTPPTLGQWMDEKGEQGRRLENPTGKLYKEGVIAIVERFEYLLIQRGEIDPTVSAGDKVIRLRPMNPLARQQDMEEITTAMQVLQGFNSTAGPQLTGAVVDLPATFSNIVKKANNSLIVVRSSDDAMPLIEATLGADQQAAPMEQAA